MITPLAYADSLRIGSVDFVSPNEIKVLLDIEAPSDVAMNTGVPRPFPRVGSYVLIPSDCDFLVAEIDWITVERSQYPKRKGMQDFGVIDLPFPLRKMSLSPLGILKEDRSGEEQSYQFSRGIDVFPTVGDPVILPLRQQLKSIIESGEKRRVKIGISPQASNADVCVDPDRLFGRHLAVLGNTGSGKSCSVAGLVRWSIETVKKEKEKTESFEDQRNDKERKTAEQGSSNDSVNCRFIVLDPNGEYFEAFKDVENARFFAVEPDEKKGIRQLRVPLWLWNSAEWCAFTEASSKAQRPTLIQALRSIRNGEIGSAESMAGHHMRGFLRTVVATLRTERAQGNPWGPFPKNKSFIEKLRKWQKGLLPDDDYSELEKESLFLLMRKVDELVQERECNYPVWDCERQEVDDLVKLASSAHSAFGGSEKDFLLVDADTPLPFSVDDLVLSIEANSELMGTQDYIDTMILRIRTLLANSRMKTITSSEDDLTLEKWLEDYICPSGYCNGAVTVIDLSLVPPEVIYIVAAVIARMTLEALQRHRTLRDGKTLPTVLIMEEAHTFVRKYAVDGEQMSAYSMCTQVFEKIAREGRKFGLGLVLSSQRPSELSPTVLSQCNSFLLHRISNDRDQDLVHRLVPDNLRGLLGELPSLPSQYAILLGWATKLPILVRLNYLEEAQRPASSDPQYWDAWVTTKNDEFKADWRAVAERWQSTGQTDSFEDTEQVMNSDFEKDGVEPPF